MTATQPYVPVRGKSPDYRIVIDPALPIRGECRRNNGEATIVLREWDEQVLLHECLHALIYEGGLAPDLDGPIEEQLVRHLSHGIYEMGWRLTPLGAVPSPESGDSGARCVLCSPNTRRDTR